MNLSTLSSAWKVFQAGQLVANPTLWKQGQVTANMVILFLAALVALLKGLGYDFPVDDTTLATVGAGVFATVNWVLTVVSTDKVGPFGQRPAEVARPAGDGVTGGIPYTPAPVGSQPALPLPPNEVRTGVEASGPTSNNMP